MNKAYIKYNIKCFFDYYCLEERIIKVNADCIILNQMIDEVNSLMDFRKTSKSADNKKKRFKLASLISLENGRSDEENAKSIKRKQNEDRKQIYCKTSTIRLTKKKLVFPIWEIKRKTSPDLIKLNNQIVKKHIKPYSNNIQNRSADTTINIKRNTKSPRSAYNTLRLFSTSHSKDRNKKQIKKKTNYSLIPFPKRFTSKIVECLYYTIHSGYLPFSTKVKLILSIRPIYFQYPKDLLTSQVLSHLEKKYNKCMFYLSKYKDINQILKPFSPSKVASSGLNFITKEEENKLVQNENALSKTISNMFIFILILLNESFDSIPKTKIISFVFQVIYFKYNVNTIKDLFMNHIIKEIDHLSNEQIEQLIKLYKNNDKLLEINSEDKKEANMSYMTYIIREIYGYVFKRTEEGTSYYILRQINNEMKHLKRVIKKLKRRLE